MVKGFQLQRRLARLTFEGNTPLVGAEVMVRLNVPLADVLSLQEYDESTEVKDHLAMLRLFSEKVLVSWNLEDDEGQPIPTQPDGMLRIPTEETVLIISGWVEALGKVPSPLGQKSSDGITSLEAQQPTGVS